MTNQRFIIALALCLIAALTLFGTPETDSEFGFRSLMPPILAIALALSSRQVILALLGGIWLGASYLEGGAVGIGLLRTLDEHLVGKKQRFIEPNKHALRRGAQYALTGQ